jgi:predicted RNase H-like nuclease (RuvC/YqgF family)
VKVKDTLSDIGKSIGKSAETAMKKSGELLSISKLMLAISSEESNIKDIYSKIGEKIYKRHEKGKLEHKEYEDREFEDYFKDIEKCKKEIRELKREVDKVKNIKLCSICGSEIKKGAKFCPECGGKQ